MVYLRSLTIAAFLVAASIVILSPRIDAQDQTAPRYSPSGELLAPVGYETWVFVGSNLGMAYRPDLPMMTAAEGARAGLQQFHNVYIDPAAYAHFRATRQFPEPTILVMELFAAADREPQGVVAAGVFNGARTGLEVAVKNSRRPDGKTTTWAYYDFTDRSDGSRTKASAPASDDSRCEACHRRHARPDNVWVQFYPVLRKFLP